MSFRVVTGEEIVKLRQAWYDSPQDPRPAMKVANVGHHTAVRYRPVDLPPLLDNRYGPNASYLAKKEVATKRMSAKLREIVEQKAEVRPEARPEPVEKVLAPESTIDAPDAEEKQEGRMLAIGRINATNLSAGAAVVSGLMKKSTHSLHKRVDEIDDPHELVDIIYKLAKTSRELATASKCLIEASRLRRGEINPLVNINVEHNKTLEVGSALQALEDVAHVYELAKRRKVAALEQSIDVTIDAHKEGTGDAS